MADASANASTSADASADADDAKAQKIKAMITQYLDCVTNKLQVEAISYLMDNKDAAKKWVSCTFGELVGNCKSGDPVAMRRAECMRILIDAMYPDK
jgi:hypothetical protein